MPNNDLGRYVTAAMQQSIPARLAKLAGEYPEARAFGFINRHGEQFFSWGEIAQEAQKVAHSLIEQGLVQGTRVGLLAASTPDFAKHIFGVLCAGGIPVTLPTVSSVSRNTGDNRHDKMLANAGAELMLVSSAEQEFAQQLSTPSITIHSGEAAAGGDAASAANAPLPRVSAGDLALLQPTSGTTEFPRAVAVRGGHIFATCAAMAVHLGMKGLPGEQTGNQVRNWAHGSGEVLVSWLPLYHDMGLIISLFMATLLGAPSYIIAPMSFLLRPAIWLQTISRFGGTFSAAPNFGYAHAASKIRARELEGLDLTSWRYAVAGAEPVLAATCDAFAGRFAAQGFTASAFVPGYGLAENTLAVSMAAPGRKIEQASPRGRADRSYVNCGRPLPGTEIRIVDEQGRPVAEGIVGQIEIRGLSLMAGYVRGGGEPVVPLHDSWLATGDLGFLIDGALYVTGRLKELIIRGGRNLHPHELEAAAAHALGEQRREVVALGITDSALGSERVILLVEVAQRDADADARVVESVKLAVHSRLDVVPDDVVLVPPRTIRRTTSGKLMRVSAREHYLAELAKSATPSPSARTTARIGG